MNQALYDEINAEREEAGRKYREKTGDSICRAPEYQRLTPHVDVLRCDILSKGINTREDLESFVEDIEKRNPEPLGRFSSSFSEKISFTISTIFEQYAVPVQDLNSDNLRLTWAYDYPQSEEETTRELPNTTNKKELVNRIANMRKIRQRIEGKPETMFNQFIFPRFDDWRAAIVFAQHSHFWRDHVKSEGREGGIYKPVSRVANINHERYLRFGITSEEAVRTVKPGALFEIENTFGDQAREYINGDLEKFKELLGYCQSKKSRALLSGLSLQKIKSFG